MTRIILGMVGFAGSGKDTVASHIVDTYRFDKISFAKALKDMLSSMFGWDRDLLEGTTAESRTWRETPDIWWEEKLRWSDHPLRVYSERFTPRAAMQLIGTQLLRGQFCDDLWTLRVGKFLETTSSNIIVTDCRFINELDMIKNYNGKIIRVKRGEDPSWYNTACDAMNKDSPTQQESYKFMKSTGIHESEWHWAGYPFDIVLDNNGTLGQLIDLVDTKLELPATLKSA